MPRQIRKGGAFMPSSQLKERNHQDTVYIVEDVISDTAKETVMDKVQKLILRDAEDLAKDSAISP
nr:MAG TPA: transposon-encoded protein [Caudoviricetes sp.]